MTGAIVELNTLFLNDQNLVDSSLQNTSLTRSKYHYDNNGYLVLKLVYNTNNELLETLSQQIVNGTISSISSVTQSGLQDYLYQYSNYDLNRTYTLDNEHIGQAFRGKRFKNMAKKVSIMNISGMSEFAYEPVYDNKNRIIKVTNYSGTNSLAIENYEYY